MAGKREDKATADGAADASVRVWWSMFGKLADEEHGAKSPSADLIERASKVEDRLRLALAARGDLGHVPPRLRGRKAEGKAAGLRLARFKFSG